LSRFVQLFFPQRDEFGEVRLAGDPENDIGTLVDHDSGARPWGVF
jgi:hypothetical protein